MRLPCIKGAGADDGALHRIPALLCRVQTGDIVNRCSETWLTLLALGKALWSCAMPWSEVSVMSLREEFVCLAGQEGSNLRELCRRYGISAPTAYKWLARDAPGRPRGSGRSLAPSAWLALAHAQPHRGRCPGDPQCASGMGWTQDRLPPDGPGTRRGAGHLDDHRDPAPAWPAGSGREREERGLPAPRAARGQRSVADGLQGPLRHID